MKTKSLTKIKKYIPFGAPDFTGGEVEAVAEVLRSGWIGMGQQVKLFEEELALYTGALHVVTVDSCTSALFLALKVSGIKKGDEVIVPSFTWCSSANAVLYCDAEPVFCDINESTFCCGADEILKKITPATKAVIVVHYGGFAVDVANIRKAIPSHIKIIEDAAHAFGASYPGGGRVGSSGNLTCFSFYANKNLSTGEGGALCTNDEALARKVRSLRQHGMPINAWNRFTNPKAILYSPVEQVGYKMNYIDLHAAIGRVQLQRFSGMQRRRSNVSNKYFASFSSLSPEIKFQSGLTDDSHAKHLFAIRLPLKKLENSRDEIIVRMREGNAGASVHYMPLHMMKVYQRGKKSKLPVAEKVFSEIMTMPISASINDEEVEAIIELFVQSFK